jgi:hypothetical protein
MEYDEEKALKRKWLNADKGLGTIWSWYKV